MKSIPIPQVSGAQKNMGHYEEFCDNPALFLQRAYNENGEVCEFDLAGLKTVLMVSPAAQEAVFRAPDDLLSAAEAYQMMVPVFGQGIQYGAPPQIERQQLKMQARGLRQDRMKTYAAVIAKEVEDWVSDWGDEGELDIYDAFTRLTLKTSTHCLMGSEFRYSLTDEFADLYHDLEYAVSPAALRDPQGQEQVAVRRDIARARLGELIGERIALRRQDNQEYDDMLQVYLDATYEDGTGLSDDEICGMVIWFMFAGHHTSGNTSSWAAVELARHAELAGDITLQIDELFRHTTELSRNALKEIPLLDAFILETLRLHPPLVTLTRRVMQGFDYADYHIEAGT